MHMDRRQFVKNLGLGTASLSMGSLVTASSCAPSGDSSLKQNVKEGEDGQFLFIGDDIAIAQTEYGKVQGYLLNHVYTFLGVPYGADTSGKNRFMPPQKPEPWTDVRPAVFYGNTAPQRMENRWPNNYGTFADHWNYWDVSEDCLYLMYGHRALRMVRNVPYWCGCMAAVLQMVVGSSRMDIMERI